MQKPITHSARICLLSALLGFALLVSACSLFSRSTPALDQAEKNWLAQGIQSYTIEVQEIHSIWHAQSQKITVRDGKVVDSSAACMGAPSEGAGCKIQPFKPEDYTVPGLFALARAQLKSDKAKFTKISYDPQYGFPVSIGYDDPQILDEDWGWHVSKFEVLK